MRSINHWADYSLEWFLALHGIFRAGGQNALLGLAQGDVESSPRVCKLLIINDLQSVEKVEASGTAIASKRLP